MLIKKLWRSLLNFQCSFWSADAHWKTQNTVFCFFSRKFNKSTATLLVWVLAWAKFEKNGEEHHFCCTHMWTSVCTFLSWLILRKIHQSKEETPTRALGINRKLGLPTWSAFFTKWVSGAMVLLSLWAEMSSGNIFKFFGNLSAKAGGHFSKWLWIFRLQKRLGPGVVCTFAKWINFSSKCHPARAHFINPKFGPFFVENGIYGNLFLGCHTSRREFAGSTCEEK